MRHSRAVRSSVSTSASTARSTGYLAKTGDYKEYLSNSPDLVFPQTWGPREIFFAVAAYERDKGSGMTVIYPREKSAWNGTVWVTAHGRGVSFKEGQLKPWNQNLDPADPSAIWRTSATTRKSRAIRG